MPLAPAINTQVTITSRSLAGDNVAKVFNKVIGLNYDYFKGMVNVVDAEQGSFYFPLIPVTTITTVVSGTSINVTIS